MTIIQPNKTSNALNWIIIGLGSMLMISAVWLVMLYNQTVNIRHAVTDIRAQIGEVTAANADLKERTFSLLNSSQLDQVVVSAGLVEDKSPVYFEVNSKWALASASQY